MVDFNIRDALQRRFNQQNINQAKINVQTSAVNADAGGQNSTQNLVKQMQNNLINNLQQQILMPQNVRMNHLASVDRSIYIKNLLQLPDNITDLLMTFGNDKTEAQMKEALKQNQQFLNNLNNVLQQNQNRLNMQEFIQNRFNNVQQNQQGQQGQIQNPAQNQGQQGNNVPQQPNQNVNNPQVQPPFVPPNDKNNNNTGNKVPQNPNQNQQHQNGKQDPNDIKQPSNRLPNTPSDAFDKTLDQINQKPQNPNLPNNKPNVPNNPNRPNIPNNPNRPNVPNQPLPPQPNVPNRPNIPNNPNRPDMPNNPNRPNVPNQPLPPQPNIPNIPNRPNHSNRPNGITGGAANITDNIQPEPETRPTPTPSTINHRIHSRLINDMRFEHMSNLRDSVRNHIRRPVELRPQAPTEQLQEEVSQELKQLQNQEAAQLAQKQVSAKVLPSKINLSVLNSQIQQHSKQALNNLVLEMSTATRQGITDTKPIQDTISLINSSISASSQNDTALAIKNLMLLYLPWLPLEEGVGFKLDVETKKAEPPKDDDTSISIMITTKNYGNIGAEINLLTTNSVDIFITCDKKFPKDELLKRLNHDSKEHSMTASIGIEQTVQQDVLAPEVQKAKVNLSNVTTINPYLLLMSHSFIRHAIEIDINTTMYGQPVVS